MSEKMEKGEKRQQIENDSDSIVVSHTGRKEKQEGRKRPAQRPVLLPFELPAAAAVEKVLGGDKGGGEGEGGGSMCNSSIITRGSEKKWGGGGGIERSPKN